MKTNNRFLHPLFLVIFLISSYNIDLYSQTAGEYIYNRDEFLQEAFSDGLKEVQLAQLVQEKVSSEKVKAYAGMLEENHSNANEELLELARRNRWTIPNQMLTKHLQEFERLSALSGDQLEKEYLSVMVNGHQKLIDVFRAALYSIRDEELSDWAGNVVPVLEKHLERAQELQADKKDK